MTVLIIDSQTLFAEAMVLALSEREFEVLPVTTTAAEGVKSGSEECPDLILIDPRLPDGNGIKAGAEILERCPSTKMVVLTDIRDAGMLGEAIRTGFRAYLTKDVSLDYFLQVIKLVLDGAIVIPEGLAAEAAGARSPDAQEAQRLKEQLTARELAVLRLLVNGVSGPEVARELSISPNTVRSYIQNILTKLQVHSRLEAVAEAVRYRLVEPPTNNRWHST